MKETIVADLELTTGVQTPFMLTGEIDALLAELQRRFLRVIRENSKHSCKYRVTITSTPMKEPTE